MLTGVTSIFSCYVMDVFVSHSDATTLPNEYSFFKVLASSSRKLQKGNKNIVANIRQYLAENQVVWFTFTSKGNAHTSKVKLIKGSECRAPRIKSVSLKVSGQLHAAPAALLFAPEGIKIDAVTKMFTAWYIIHAQVTGSLTIFSVFLVNGWNIKEHSSFKFCHISTIPIHNSKCNTCVKSTLWRRIRVSRSRSTKSPSKINTFWSFRLRFWGTSGSCKIAIWFQEEYRFLYRHNLTAANMTTKCTVRAHACNTATQTLLARTENSVPFTDYLC